MSLDAFSARVCACFLLLLFATVAKPPVSSTGSPYTDDSSEVSQSSAKPQQPIVSEFPDGGPVLSKQPFGGPVEFDWPFSDPVSELRLGADFLSLASGSPFVVVVFPPSPRRLLRDLAAGSTMSDSGEEIPTSGEDYQLFPRRLFSGDNPETAVMSTSSPSLSLGYRSLGQIISAAASMGVSAPSPRPAAPSLEVSP